MAFELTGRVALITGAGRGMGRRTAELLHEQGAEIIATDINEAEVAGLARQLGQRARHMRHDVTSAESWAEVIASIEGQEGRLGILVNNAGINVNANFLATSYETYKRVMTVNVDSVWIGLQTALPLLQRSAKDLPFGASVINFSSVWGQNRSSVVASAYSASKGAVRMLTKAVALEFARGDGRVRVNSVHPGSIETELSMVAIREAVELGYLPDERAGYDMVASATPLGRWGQPNDVAGAVLFLASDASAFITGAELTIDGGAGLQ